MKKKISDIEKLYARIQGYLQRGQLCPQAADPDVRRIRKHEDREDPDCDK